jgi:hypothetical protein
LDEHVIVPGLHRIHTPQQLLRLNRLCRLGFPVGDHLLPAILRGGLIVLSDLDIGSLPGFNGSSWIAAGHLENGNQPAPNLRKTDRERG